ncbi:MAG: LysM peptidoglycan-binding domain-containing protein [Chloroflexota bacterium]
MSYAVKQGDTALGIALSYGLTLDQLAEYNNISTETLSLLQIGQELNIRPPTETLAPTPTPTGTPTNTPTPEAVFETATPSPTATIALASVATPQLSASEGDSGRNWSTALGIGAMVGGLILTVLAGVAVMLLWHKQ